MALPGVSDGGAHTKFVTTARYADRAAGLLGARARDHVAGGGALAPLGVPGDGRRPARTAARSPRASLPTSIVYDPDTVDASRQERLYDYPAGEWRLVQKAVGYDRIIVNGVTTFIDGECTDATPGQLLRHGTD